MHHLVLIFVNKENMYTPTFDEKCKYTHYCPPYQSYIKGMRMMGIEGHQITTENFWKTLVRLTILLMVNANHLRLCFGKNEKFVKMFRHIFHKEPVFKKIPF